MPQYNVGSLKDVSAVTTDIVSGKLQTADPVRKWFEDFRARIADLNAAVQAVASAQAGTGPPANRQGGIWCDDTNNKWLGDPDGLGYDDDFATRLKAGGILFASGGTAAHKLLGVIHRNTTAESEPGNGAGLMSFTLPANTLDTNGKLLRVTCWGTKVGINSTVALLLLLGGFVQKTYVLAATETDWYVQWIIVRTTGSAQTWSTLRTPNSDALGRVLLADSGTDTKDSGINLQLGVNVNSGSPDDTITQEGMLVELLN